MNRKRVKTGIGLFTLIIAIAAGIGFWLFSKPNTSVSKLEPQYSLTAEKLYEAFEISEADASSKYVDAVIEVSGAIISINKNEHGNISITLKDEMFGVNCSLSDKFTTEHVNTINSLNNGDLITLKGICTGMLNDVKLSRCVITDP